MAKQIAVLGAGAWGTAMAVLLADNGHDVRLWCYESEVACDIATFRMNKKYLPDVLLSERITAITDIAHACNGAEWIFESVPSKFIRTILHDVKHAAPSTERLPWVILSKGIEQDSLLAPSQILQEVFDNRDMSIVVLGGPNFAAELTQRAMTATVIASHNKQLATDLAALVRNDYFRPIISDDMIGIQVCGAIKNVLAVAIGLAQGAGYKHENTRALLITQGLAEVAVLVEHFGGKKETVYGYAGLGDLFLTCAGSLSKNLRVGKMLGKGAQLDELSASLPALPEGISSSVALYELIKKHDLDLPLCCSVYESVFEDKPFGNVFDAL
jgi:glycerol-3-phosphate dehydrogenase (NAD(P)+)